jgi:hypothetical protein
MLKETDRNCRKSLSALKVVALENAESALVNLKSALENATSN